MPLETISRIKAAAGQRVVRKLASLGRRVDDLAIKARKIGEIVQTGGITEEFTLLKENTYLRNALQVEKNSRHELATAELTDLLDGLTGSLKHIISNALSGITHNVDYILEGDFPEAERPEIINEYRAGVTRFEALVFNLRAISYSMAGQPDLQKCLGGYCGILNEKNVAGKVLLLEPSLPDDSPPLPRVDLMSSVLLYKIMQPLFQRSKFGTETTISFADERPLLRVDFCCGDNVSFPDLEFMRALAVKAGGRLEMNAAEGRTKISLWLLFDL